MWSQGSVSVSNRDTFFQRQSWEYWNMDLMLQTCFSVVLPLVYYGRFFFSFSTIWFLAESVSVWSLLFSDCRRDCKLCRICFCSRRSSYPSRRIKYYREVFTVLIYFLLSWITTSQLHVGNMNVFSMIFAWYPIIQCCFSRHNSERAAT